MPREKEAYRDNLARIDLFRVKESISGEVLNKTQVKLFLGIDKESKLITSLPFKNNYISIATLARELS